MTRLVEEGSFIPLSTHLRRGAIIRVHWASDSVVAATGHLMVLRALVVMAIHA